ncbi:MAG: hypothetical protein V4557_00210 [Bacteroidota bacterium]
MRPKLTLLLVLAIATVTFMAFLIGESKSEKMVCKEKTCCEKQVPCPESGGGADDNPNGTINHLIVSTIK